MIWWRFVPILIFYFVLQGRYERLDTRILILEEKVRLGDRGNLEDIENYIRYGAFSPELEDLIRSYLLEGRKKEAQDFLRERTGMDQVDAEIYVDEFIEDYRADMDLD